MSQYLQGCASGCKVRELRMFEPAIEQVSVFELTADRCKQGAGLSDQCVRADAWLPGHQCFFVGGESNAKQRPSLGRLLAVYGS
ncbi:hypothetical protein ABTL46_21905, partial [Acinetobacter baumannii]